MTMAKIRGYEITCRERLERMSRFKVLIVDEVDKLLITKLRERGFAVEYRPKINLEELLKIIQHYNILILRGCLLYTSPSPRDS